MTLDNLLEIYRFAAEIHGYDKEITINDFNNSLWWADIELRRDLYGRVWDEDGYETSQENTDSVSVMKETATVALTIGVGTLPSDYFHTSSVLYGDIDVKYITDRDYARRKNNEITKPTTTYPVYIIKDGKINVYPTSITSITLDYLKISTSTTKPILALKSENGIDVYDSVNSTELVWGDEHMPDILRLMLEQLDISVNNLQSASYLEQLKDKNR